MSASARLYELADRCGVATEYWDWQGRHVRVEDATIHAVLAAMGRPAGTAEEVEASLAAVDDEPWRRLLPPVVVMTQGNPTQFFVHVPDGDPVRAHVRDEQGRRHEIDQLDRWVPPREVDGRLVGEATFRIGGDLPLGWHWIVVNTPSGEHSCQLIVTPARMPLPEPVWGSQRWGFMAQLYSVRSRQSWGIGDFADLRELVAWSGRDLAADFLLVNPLHAAEPVPPMANSPYLPTTRRFVNPIYIRVEDIREAGYLSVEQRTLVEDAREPVADRDTDAALIDRDVCWAAKLAALEVIYQVPRTASREAAFAEYRHAEGDGLTSFATWCAMAEHLGLPAKEWPAELRDPNSAETADLTASLAERIKFQQWLQWVADEQLGAAQAEARDAGMTCGLVLDLAVGVHPDGADTWALGSALAAGVSVGAPPDAFNQQGQNWSQPPWRPDTLAESAYAPYRDMLRTVLRHAGGLRVDHVMGLFRLWWIPDGADPGQGTYVHYDDEALLGIMCLEAERAGAFLVGEDLGVVEPRVREILSARGVLGTSVLWFERRENGEPLPPEEYRELCLATVTTHDLPPTAGYLHGDHVTLREELGLLTRPLAEERAVDAAERESVMHLLRSRGLIDDGADEQAVIEALHRLLTDAPSRLVGVMLTDAVGQRSTQNQPGTDQEYPNWRIPLADGAGTPVLVEDLRASARVASLAAIVCRA
ncbi:MAG: 4-alpha-glucanotransferase [Actinomycetales bacterium]